MRNHDFVSDGFPALIATAPHGAVQLPMSIGA
jgi:hypothetical protein